MPRYLIERNLPDAGRLSDSDRRAIAQKSCDVLRTLGPEIQWVRSFVTQDMLVCEYIAPSEQLIREHARRGEFPCDVIREVTSICDPTTAEAPKTSAA